MQAMHKRRRAHEQLMNIIILPRTRIHPNLSLNDKEAHTLKVHRGTPHPLILTQHRLLRLQSPQCRIFHPLTDSTLHKRLRTDLANISTHKITHMEVRRPRQGMDINRMRLMRQVVRYFLPCKNLEHANKGDQITLLWAAAMNNMTHTKHILLKNQAAMPSPACQEQ